MTNLIINIIEMINNLINFLLPDTLFLVDVFTNFANNLNTFTDFLIAVNFLIPLPTVFTCLGLILTVKIIKFNIFIYNWFIRAVLDVIP